jgi:predicted DNA-binding transcriptional regulator YafY
MRDAVLLERSFEPKKMPEYNEEPAMLPRAYPQIKLRFKNAKNFRLYDDFDPRDISQNPDDSCDAVIYAPIDEQFIGYILSYGSGAEVLEPKSLRDAVKETLEKSLRTYL